MSILDTPLRVILRGLWCAVGAAVVSFFVIAVGIGIAQEWPWVPGEAWGFVWFVLAILSGAVVGRLIWGKK